MPPLDPSNMKSGITNDGKRWTVILNVTYFRPEDISVKTIGATVEVKAKQEENEDRDGGIIR